VRSAVRVELLEDPLHMKLDGVLADAEDHGNIPGAFPFFDPAQDFPFPGRQGDGASLRPVFQETDESLMEMGSYIFQDELGARLLPDGLACIGKKAPFASIKGPLAD
jgi:hypothetical protein